jgi:hypothetical protein
MIIKQVLGGAFRTVFRLLLTVILGGALGGATTLLVAYQQTRTWPPQQITAVAAIAIAALTAYGAAMTVLTGAIIRGFVAAAKVAAKEATTAGNIVEAGIKAAEKL